MRRNYQRQLGEAISEPQIFAEALGSQDPHLQENWERELGLKASTRRLGNGGSAIRDPKRQIIVIMVNLTLVEIFVTGFRGTSKQ
ncbi:uncharacterized protein CLUP02_04585 [Colletotrichum lupini]|uniref:Uncharacterized protein n=1 Tax=Colletotrichum lupini TaxID=145971 RepID=A0A9Q8SLL2_9PEZI|nr:uncharacterized protein CLUP02_04585 [Colletotrichum lupini]UQC79106.1 hypothetical protein CLUP02_04585 [Colletotrichum lupini]